jgi:hypothetical protein
MAEFDLVCEAGLRNGPDLRLGLFRAISNRGHAFRILLQHDQDAVRDVYPAVRSFMLA